MKKKLLKCGSSAALLIVVFLIGILIVRNDIEQPFFKKFKQFRIQDLFFPTRYVGENFRFKVEKISPDGTKLEQISSLIVREKKGRIIGFERLDEFKNGFIRSSVVKGDANPFFENYAYESPFSSYQRRYENYYSRMFPLNSLSSFDYRYKFIDNGEERSKESYDCRVDGATHLILFGSLEVPVVLVYCQNHASRLSYKKYYYYPPIGFWVKRESVEPHPQGVTSETWSLVGYGYGEHQPVKAAVNVDMFDLLEKFDLEYQQMRDSH